MYFPKQNQRSEWQLHNLSYPVRSFVDTISRLSCYSLVSKSIASPPLKFGLFWALGSLHDAYLPTYLTRPKLEAGGVDTF